jgi:hypothetical protein
MTAGKITSRLRPPYWRSDVFLGQYLWREVLLKTYRSGRGSYDTLLQRINYPGIAANSADTELALLEAYGAADAATRASALEPLDERQDRHIASWSTLRAIQSEQVEIGVHGACHLPLTSVNSRQDLVLARATIQDELGPNAVLALSFPHGRYDSDTCSVARRLGFELLFTSDPKLNLCPKGFLSSDLLGRMAIETWFLCDDKGQFDVRRAERWFFHRDRMPLN